MGRKRKHPTLEELLERVWCYYCEREFEDLKLLISHQKAKHFKCDRCGRRLNTAGGLSVHMTQVHKETLSHVENALPNRQGLDVEIFGMEGVPEDIVLQHRQHIEKEYFQSQAERQNATGNPPSGVSGANSRKKLKFEDDGELKKRLAEYVARRKAEKTAAVTAAVQQPLGVQPPPPLGVFPPGGPNYAPNAVAGFNNGFHSSGLPARPSSGRPQTGIQPGAPQRPGQLPEGAAAGAAAVPPSNKAADAAASGKKKKGSSRMFFSLDQCPEEILFARLVKA